MPDSADADSGRDLKNFFHKTSQFFEFFIKLLSNLNVIASFFHV